MLYRINYDDDATCMCIYSEWFGFIGLVGLSAVGVDVRVVDTKYKILEQYER